MPPPTPIQNFRCEQIPELKIIGIGSPVKHLVHAVQVVSLLTNKDRRCASSALHVFVRASAGTRMRDGGDLVAAYSNDHLESTMLYTHYSNGCTHPAYFFTLEGVEDALRRLPNQVEDAQKRFRELFDAYIAGTSSFNLDTSTISEHGGLLQTQAEIEEDAIVLELEAVTPKTITVDWCFRVALQTEKQKSDLALEAEKARSALEVEKVKSALEGEKANMLLEAEKEKSELKLKMKDLELDKERAQYEAERAKWLSSLPSPVDEPTTKKRARLTNDDPHRTDSEGYDSESIVEDVVFVAKKKHKTTAEGSSSKSTRKYSRRQTKPKKLKPKTSHFALLRSTQWDNDMPGVNFFLDLNDEEDDEEDDDDTADEATQSLKIQMANGQEQHGKDTKKHFIIGFHYKGRRIRTRTLRNASVIVKEAYGVKANGLQYLCLVFYQKSSCAIKTVTSVLYRTGILPRNVVPELIIAGKKAEHHHVSVFKAGGKTDDPVLAMIKKPSMGKWSWVANGSKSNDGSKKICA